MFGRAIITLGIGPHSSYVLTKYDSVSDGIAVAVLRSALLCCVKMR